MVFQYVDQSITLKACAGLNGMKLGGQVLTVVQAIPNALAMVRLTVTTFQICVQCLTKINYLCYLFFYMDVYLPIKPHMLGKYWKPTILWDP